VGRGRGRRERKVERRERRLKERGGRNGGGTVLRLGIIMG
jgi:hypothetical protein